MNNNNFITIPIEIFDQCILPYIDSRIKILLTKELYFKYHNYYYDFSYKYLLFIVKKNVRICSSVLIKYNNFDLLQKNKIYFDNKIFYILYDFCIYICNKYKNYYFLEYFKVIYENNLSKDFSKLRIKQYKKFIDKNILWIK